MPTYKIIISGELPKNPDLRKQAFELLMEMCEAFQGDLAGEGLQPLSVHVRDGVTERKLPKARAVPSAIIPSSDKTPPEIPSAIAATQAAVDLVFDDDDLPPIPHQE